MAARFPMTLNKKALRSLDLFIRIACELMISCRTNARPASRWNTVTYLDSFRFSPFPGQLELKLRSSPIDQFPTTLT